MLRISINKITTDGEKLEMIKEFIFLDQRSAMKEDALQISTALAYLQRQVYSQFGKTGIFSIVKLSTCG